MQIVRKTAGWMFGLALLGGLILLLPLVTKAETVDSGQCGENMYWTLDSEGTLAISGTGKMNNYDYEDEAPWYKHSEKIVAVTIGESVTRIGNDAFSGCSSLASITIPESVTSIGWYAFNGCSGLTSITIPENVTGIAPMAFGSCSGLTSIKVASDNPAYDSRDDCNGIIEKESDTLIAGCKNTKIPESVTSIGACAFNGCSSLTSITIPSSVTSIKDHAFDGCSGLTSITIPESVTSILWAFGDCSGLTSIKVASDNPAYDSRDDCNGIIQKGSDALIAGCKNTKIPESVTSIGDSAFYGCSGLTSITIPENVTSIGSDAFSGCSGLTSVTIPSNVTIIESYAFYNCNGLKSIEIPSSVTSIGNSAFDNCSSLADVYYGGTEADRKNIQIGNYNGCLEEATWHFAKETGSQIIYGGGVGGGSANVVLKNPLKIKVAKKTFKRSQLKKAKKFKIGVSKAQGKVTYTLNKKAKKAKIKVSKKGVVTVPRKCKRGTYKITVKAAGNSRYVVGKKTVTIRVK